MHAGQGCRQDTEKPLPPCRGKLNPGTESSAFSIIALAIGGASFAGMFLFFIFDCLLALSRMHGVLIRYPVTRCKQKSSISCSGTTSYLITHYAALFVQNLSDGSLRQLGVHGTLSTATVLNSQMLTWAKPAHISSTLASYCTCVHANKTLADLRFVIEL